MPGEWEGKYDVQRIVCRVLMIADDEELLALLRQILHAYRITMAYNQRLVDKSQIPFNDLISPCIRVGLLHCFRFWLQN